MCCEKGPLCHVWAIKAQALSYQGLCRLLTELMDTVAYTDEQRRSKSDNVHLLTDIGLYYSKCPKISNTKVSDKMAYANSTDPDQTAPEGAV